MEEASTVAIEENVSYSKQSYEYIINLILDGGLKPGDEISRRKIAQTLGVSMAPVSEAVNQLESEGLLEISPRRQTRVRIVNKDEVRGMLILREAMECQAARLYCGRTLETHYGRLKALAEVVDKSEPGTKANEIAETNFHQALIDLVGCSLLSTEFAKLMRRRLFLKINLIAPWSTQPPLDNHETLLKALLDNDPDNAAKIMRLHLERGREGILR